MTDVGRHRAKTYKRPSQKPQDPRQFVSTTEPNFEDLGYFGLEISYGTRWINLNDRNRFIVATEGVRNGASKTYRKIMSQSPFLEGQYLVHAVPDLMTEQLRIWTFGIDQADLFENINRLETVFDQFSYRLRWTFDNVREYWDCQLADMAIDNSQVWAHSTMAMVALQIPRFPSTEREEII